MKMPFHRDVAVQVVLVAAGLRPGALFFRRSKPTEIDYSMINSFAQAQVQLAPYLLKDGSVVWHDRRTEICAFFEGRDWLFTGPTFKRQTNPKDGHDAGGRSLHIPPCCRKRYSLDRERGVSPVRRFQKQAGSDFAVFGIEPFWGGYRHHLLPWIPEDPKCPVTWDWMLRAALVVERAGLAYPESTFKNLISAYHRICGENEPLKMPVPPRH